MTNNIDIEEITSYSTPALNVLNKFHDCKVIMFVEGDDDILFWDVIVKKTGIDGVFIESLGGKNQINKKISQIINENARIIVACDSDYKHYMDEVPCSDQIVHTYGYSIENTMYCPASLNRFLQKLTRQINSFKEETKNWLMGFVLEAKLLLIYDIANNKYNKGVKILGDSCSKYLKSNKSQELSKKKIESFIESIKSYFTYEEIETCKEMLKNHDRQLRQIIKGHFLTLGIINMLKSKYYSVRKKRLSTLTIEHLYTGIIDSCSICDVNECIELNYMATNLLKAFNNIARTQQEHSH